MMDDTESEIAGIEKTLAEDSRTYWKDPAMQARYGELLEARETGSSAPAKPSGDVARMAEIEKVMQSREYWKSPAMQVEYRALLEGPEKAAVGDLAADWSEALGITEADAQDGLERMEGLGFSAETDQVFEGLPDGVQRACFQAMCQPAKRLELISGLSDSDWDEVEYFIEHLPEHEWSALRGALGI